MGIKKGQMENLERAFSSGCAGCRGQCACGKVFYNPGGNWDWSEGELEALDQDPEATAVDYSVGGVVIDGVDYVNACMCWVPKAKKIIAWLDHHRHEIVEWYNLEKKRKLAEAKEAPVVEDETRTPHPDL
jgi:hypothetical protein